MLINDLYTNKTPAVAENALNEFAPSDGGGDSGNYFQALASAWYNGTFDSGSLEKGIKSQQDVERLLQRGIVCPDGVTRKFTIDYGGDFDRVLIYSDDYYEHGDNDGTDSRTGKPFGPYDYMEFGDDDLDESAKWRDPQYKGQLYTQEKPDYNDTREYDRARWDPKPKGYQGRKEPIAGGEFPRTDPLVRGAGIGRTGIEHNINLSGKRKGLPSRDQITSLKQSIKDISGRHTRANLPEQGVAEEGVAEASLGDYRKKAQLSQAMAQTNRFFDRDDPAKVAAADRTIANRTKGLASADARRQPYTPPAQDAEKMQRDLTARYPNIDELVAAAEQRRDPNYDYAEGNAYYDGREAEQNYQKLKQIQRVIQGLNESLNRSHLP
jgi:hypothetical protein